MKKISVIIPIYNVEKYLKRCIESVMNQTYSNLEIILVDDGSPDNCGKICDEYQEKDSRIKVIHKKNGGLSDARNAGIKIATGEIISYIDSDDYIDKDMYEYMLSEMIREDADIVICGTKIDYDDGTTRIKNSESRKVLNTKDALIELNSFKSFDMAVWNKLYKREIIDGISFPIGKKSEDYFVMYQYFDRAKKILILPEAKYHYIQRANSISRGKNVTHDYIEGSKQQKAFFDKKYPEISFVGNTAYAFSYIATYNRYLKNKLQLPQNLKKQFKNEVKKYINDIRRNPYITKAKKMQAIIFSHNILLYNILIKLIKKG